MKLLFLHGWTSTPSGIKPTYLKTHGHEVLNPALPDDDFDEAVAIAQAEFEQHHPDVVVGSSRGGIVTQGSGRRMGENTFSPGPTPGTVRSADGKVLTAPEGWCCFRLEMLP